MNNRAKVYILNKVGESTPIGVDGSLQNLIRTTKIMELMDRQPIFDSFKKNDGRFEFQLDQTKYQITCLNLGSPFTLK